MIYEIKEGKHSSGFRFSPHRGITMETYEVVFSPDCLKVSPDPERDWSKLLGWSNGYLPDVHLGKLRPAHQINSVRVGWAPREGNEMIALSLYIYQDGIRMAGKGGIGIYVPVDTKLNIALWQTSHYYGMEVWEIRDGERFSWGGMLRNANKKLEPKPGYRLFPYYGGTYPAPGDMKISICKLY